MLKQEGHSRVYISYRGVPVLVAPHQLRKASTEELKSVELSDMLDELLAQKPRGSVTQRNFVDARGEGAAPQQPVPPDERPAPRPPMMPAAAAPEPAPPEPPWKEKLFQVNGRNEEPEPDGGADEIPSSSPADVRENLKDDVPASITTNLKTAAEKARLRARLDQDELEARAGEERCTRYNSPQLAGHDPHARRGVVGGGSASAGRP